MAVVICVSLSVVPIPGTSVWRPESIEAVMWLQTENSVLVSGSGRREKGNERNEDGIGGRKEMKLGPWDSFERNEDERDGEPHIEPL